MAYKNYTKKKPDINIDNKLPPQATDAEMAVLGAMMMEEDASQRALDILNPEHFYNNNNKQIFEAIKNLVEKNKAVDLVTVSEELKKSDALAVVGGEGYLTELMDKVSSSAHVEHYAQIVYSKAMVRDLIRVSTSTIQECFREEEDAENLIDLAQEKIFGLSKKQDLRGFHLAKDLSTEVMELIEKAHLDKNPVKGIPSGFTAFDYKTGGFRKSDLIILAARPSQGKTAMALNIIHHACVEKKVPCAIFSLEMGRHSIFERLLCGAAMADLHQVRNGMFQRSKWKDLTKELAKLAKSPLYIDDTPGVTITDIRMRSRRLANELRKQDKELGLIVIDYLQLIRSSGGRIESRQQEVSEISRMLKELARTLNVPVMALSQLNRRSEDKSREGNRPQLSDLRDSGSLEQDADVVALIHREGYYKRDDEELQKKAKLIIAKQRNGPVGDVDLSFLSQFTLFTNPLPEEVEDQVDSEVGVF